MDTLELREKILASEAIKGSYASWSDVWAELDATFVKEEFIDETRWFNLYEVTVRLGDQFFQVTEGRGATEFQENMEISDDVDSLVEVEPVEVTVVKYLRVDRPKPL